MGAWHYDVAIPGGKGSIPAVIVAGAADDRDHALRKARARFAARAEPWMLRRRVIVTVRGDGESASVEMLGRVAAGKEGV